MYQNLGIHWASSIPAFLSLACVPFPFLLYKYGATIRLKCKYSAEAAAILEELRQDDVGDEFGEDEKSDGNKEAEGDEEMGQFGKGVTEHNRKE
jgi:hypothetical protein